MYVKTIKLQNFRNYKSQTIEFSKNTNILCGNNANGKTNILEAVHLFAYGKSHRSKSDSEMIRFGEEAAKVSITFESKGRDFTGEIILSQNGKKTVKVNNVPIKKLSRLMSYFHAVLFSPDDLVLVKGSPSARRRFMDASLCRLYPAYFAALSEFKTVATEKNNLLRQLRKKGKSQDDYLSVWNERLAVVCEKIMSYRKDYCEEIARFAAKIQSEISDEVLRAAYEPSLKVSTTEEIFEFLEAGQKREIDNGSMCWGIQRDDISLHIGDLDAREYASQGQQRTTALSLRIAEADYIFEKTGEYPVLLLDDIFSELDIKRRMYLWQKIIDKQVIITCTDTDFFENTNSARLFRVADCSVVEEKI